MALSHRPILKKLALTGGRGPKELLWNAGLEGLGPPITNGTLRLLGYLPAGFWADSISFEGFWMPFRAMFLPVMLGWQILGDFK